MSQMLPERILYPGWCLRSLSHSLSVKVLMTFAIFIISEQIKIDSLIFLKI